MGSKRLKGTRTWDDFDATAVQLDDLKQQKKIITERESELQEELLIGLDERGVKTHTLVHDGRKIKVTKVEGSNLVIDEPRLKRRLGSVLWNRVTTRVLDRKKLDALIAAGDVDMAIVAECSEDKPRKPFLKVT